MKAPTTVWKRPSADTRFTDWYADGVTWRDFPYNAKLLNVPESDLDTLYPFGTRKAAKAAWERKALRMTA